MKTVQEGQTIYINKVKRTQKNGWKHVYEIHSFYDPKSQNTRILKTKLLGKLPPGEEDISKMQPTDKRRSRKKAPTDQPQAVLQASGSLMDSRRACCVIYPLDIALFVVLMAGVNGFTSNYAIAEFWKTHHSIFERWFPDFPESDPSHDTVRRLIMILGKHNGKELLERLTRPLVSELSERVVAVDGQAVRASSHGKNGPRYVLNVYDSDNGVCLSQRLIGCKENEIVHAADLISTLDLHGAVVTCDAMNTQVKFAESVIQKGADCCLAVKANHPHLHDFIQKLFASASASKIAKSEEKIDIGHGRIETREIRVLPGSLIEIDKETVKAWKWLPDGCLVEARTTRVEKKNPENSSTDTRYYITTLNFDEQYIAPRLMRIIRQHWGIENSLHWVLDVTFNQDRTQCSNADYLLGRTTLTKIVTNVLSKIQTDEEERTGKNAPSKPVLMARMSNLDAALQALVEIYRSTK